MRHLFRESIRFRFLAFTTAILLATALVMSAVIAAHEYHVFMDTLRAEGEGLARFAASIGREPLVARDSVALDMIANEASRDDIAYTIFYDAQGAPLSTQYASINYRSPRFQDSLANIPADYDIQRIVTALNYQQSIIEFSAPVTFGIKPVGSVLVGMSGDAIRKHVGETALFVLLLLGVITSLLGLILFLISRRMIFSPLAAISGAARRLATGDLGSRARVPAVGELMNLRDDFNRMADSLERHDEAMTSANHSLSEQIRERERVEVALRHQEEYFRALIENSYDIITVLDANARIVYESPSVERILGYRPLERSGLSPFDFIHPDDVRQTKEAFADVLAQYGNIVTTELRYRRNDGAWRFLAIKAINLLDAPAVKGIVLNISDISDQKTLELHLDTLAHFDHLTGLPNRLLFYDRLKLAIAQSRRHPERQIFAVMFIDIDHFKRINDSLGHDSGDLLLTMVARRLSSCVREGDTVARNGGDEFLVILPEIGGEQNAAAIAQKMLTALSAPYLLKSSEVFVSASIGIALYPTDGDSKEVLVKNADMAMFRAKEDGRDMYRFHTQDMDSNVLKRISIESDLHHAIEQREFLLYYQPKVSLDTGRLIGVEALLRWNSPRHGLVSPSEFIPVAEETGMIVPIGEWTLQAACMQGAAWMRDGCAPITVAVNLSARQFRQADLIEKIASILETTGFEPSCFEVEITESLAMQDPDVSANKMKALCALGVKISIDDFGTGYSSLAYLKHFPINTLKIDRSFICNITEDKDDLSITSAVIAMAQTLNLKVVAEGVETDEQRALLQRLGCNEIQGYLISKPVPAVSIAPFIGRRCVASV